MIRHLFKLVWARKRANLLLVVEIFISFLVVFAVALLGVSNLRRLQAPLGFSWDSTYLLSASFSSIEDSRRHSDSAEKTSLILDQLRALPEVEATAAAYLAPFEMAAATNMVEHEGRLVQARFTELSDDADRVFGLEMAHGRWFEPGDDAFEWRPVVINRLLAEELFGDEDPLGRIVDPQSTDRVVGVIEEFRWSGELSRVQAAAVYRLSSTKPNSSRPTRFVVRTRPGTTADFEARALRTVQSVVPEWTVKIQTLEETRRTGLRMALVPFVVATCVAGSLMLMVALGMVGVFWQTVTSRTHEIGLRRALGGSRARIFAQLLGEVLVLTSIAVAAGAVVVLQLPLLGLLRDTDWPTITGALLTAAGSMCALATASGLYPAWLAARVQPADALHDE